MSLMRYTNCVGLPSLMVHKSMVILGGNVLLDILELE